MNLRILLGMVLAMNCAVALAQSAGTAGSPYHLRDPQAWGTLSRVVQPEYPGEALARRQSGTVEVEGVVLGSGVLADVTYTPDSASSAAFVPALQEVVPQWLFYTPVGSDCMPVRQRVTTRVSFEFVGDAPKVFLTRLKPERSTPPPANFLVSHDLPPAYPRTMVQRGWEAKVYSRVEIDPAGRAVDINTVAYSRFTRQPNQLAEFEKPVEFALGSWRYAAAPDGRPASRFACIDVEYKLKS